MTSSSPTPSPTTSSSPGDTLDLCGEVCPFTFVRTKIALEALAMGASLRVIVDHPPARDNVPRSARGWGQEVTGVVELPGPRWAIDLVKRVR